MPHVQRTACSVHERRLSQNNATDQHGRSEGTNISHIWCLMRASLDPPRPRGPWLSIAPAVHARTPESRRNVTKADSTGNWRPFPSQSADHENLHCYRRVSLVSFSKTPPTNVALTPRENLGPPVAGRVLGPVHGRPHVPVPRIFSVVVAPSATRPPPRGRRTPSRPHLRAHASASIVGRAVCSGERKRVPPARPPPLLENSARDCVIPLVLLLRRFLHRAA